MSKILIVVAHPDDEVLGCGGTIVKYSKEHEIYCIILGEGAMARIGSSLEDVQKLNEQRKAVAKLLGFEEVKHHFAPDNEFDRNTLLSYIRTIESDLSQLGSMDYVFTYFPMDLNIDHRMTSQAVQTVFRPQPHTICKALLFFEVLSSTEWNYDRPFNPSLYVDITEVLPEKLAAFACYEDEVMKEPHPRSFGGIENLAKRRGYEIGFEAAEAFMVGYIRNFNL